MADTAYTDVDHIGIHGQAGTRPKASSPEQTPIANDDLLQQTCRVDRILISGLNRTNKDVVHRELEGLAAARTLEQIADFLQEAHDRLETLGIFQAVEITIDGSPKSPERCTVLVNVKESNLFGLRAGTYVQGAEGTVEASLTLNNPIGHAEQISIGIEHGTQHSNVYSVAYTLPKPWGLPAIADLRLHQLFSDREPWSSYVERLRGGLATISSGDGRHAVTYELGWQRLSNPSRTASREVLPHLGDYVKSAVKYAFSAHAFDDFAFPRSGWGVRASSELAGIGLADNLLRFAKQHVTGQLAFPVGEESALHIEATAGILLPWGTGVRGASISDRFFLGGVGVDGLRGFCYRGVGPSDLRRPSPDAVENTQQNVSRRMDALGGNVVCSLLAALRFGLPYESCRAAGLRGQIFVNCGSIGDIKDMATTFASTVRCSVGAGIVWPTGIGKLELNVCRVVKGAALDEVKHGIQFGFTPPM